MHRTKSILAALAAVALSATAVFAAASAPPQAAADGLKTALSASGKIVLPARTERPDATSGTKSPEANETPEANESPKAAKSPDTDATTGTNAPHPDNHGKTVSEAAHATTPAGFANHGAYVSSIAKLNHGHGKPTATKPVTAHVPTPTPTTH